MTAAIKTYPLLFVALAAVIWAPSGDQLRTMSRRIYIGKEGGHLGRRKNVMGDLSKGFLISASSSQSVVRHTLTDRSSD